MAWPMDIIDTAIRKPQTARDLTHEYAFMSLAIDIVHSDIENVRMCIVAWLGISVIVGS